MTRGAATPSGYCFAEVSEILSTIAANIPVANSDYGTMWFHTAEEEIYLLYVNIMCTEI